MRVPLALSRLCDAATHSVLPLYRYRCMLSVCRSLSLSLCVCVCVCVCVCARVCVPLAQVPKHPEIGILGVNAGALGIKDSTSIGIEWHIDSAPGVPH